VKSGAKRGGGNMDDEDMLRKLLQKYQSEEKPNLDFKREINLSATREKIELAKDIAAMCNLHGGGYILYGFEDDGTPVGIDPSTFDEEQIAQIISNRCLLPSPGIKAEIVDYREGSNRYKIGVITIPQSPFEYPTCFKDANGNLKAPVRIGPTTSYLTPVEAVEYYKERRRDKAPDFFPVDINNMGFFDIDLQNKAPFIKVQSQPFEKLGSVLTPSIPIPISFFPQLPKKKVVLSSWCAGFTGADWLKEFKEIEQLIHKYHGIIAQMWCIRNWDLLSPLPEKMEYFFGSSIDNLERTINEQDIRKYAYIGWVVVAYKQIVYVLSGQMNNMLNMNVYLPYVPKSNLFVCRSESRIGVAPQNLWFSEIQGENVFEYSEIKYWSSDYPSDELLEAQPTARIIGYIGSPNDSSPFKIKGLHILEIEED